MKTRGFTLIELLIVVAIIAILAAIAVSNFLEAQVWAKVSRTHSDLRSLANALEVYHVDHNQYPPVGPTTWAQDQGRHTRLVPLTTPVAYITTVPTDPFFQNEPTRGTYHPSGRRDDRAYPYWDPIITDQYKVSAMGYFRYMPEERMRKGRWTLLGAGPDRDYEPATEMGGSYYLWPYDPTNGTVSEGNILRFGP